MDSSLSNSKQIGSFYEQQACRFLQRQGLKLIDKNVKLKKGEIDLIMQEGSCLVFIEVKYRTLPNYGGAISSISSQKQRILLKTAYLWLAKQKLSAVQSEYRFDAVTFEGDTNKVNWIKNIVTDM